MLLTPLQACIFDMDGVLLDSEPFWRQAEMEVFATVGLHLTEEDCMQTMGVRIDEVVALRHLQKPWSSPSCSEVADRIVERVAELIQTRGRPLEGVGEALEFLQEKGLSLALASSSSSRLIRTALETLELTSAFPVWHSAEYEEFGKPHPAVFLATARKLGVAPASCLVIEDSLNGVVAAFAAGMPALAVPEPAVAQDPRFALAQAVLGSLRELPEAWERLVG
ncbi:MAG: hexitol phosphatase HxpB [Burkholderiales bacterium]|nr:hexitol phosphatase HxpB [Burkholderiales bacterium]